MARARPAGRYGQELKVQMRYHWFGPGDGLLMIGGLLLLIALVVLVVWGVNTMTRSDRAPRGWSGDPSRPSPTDILRERFARGEISEEQFEQAKKVLGRDG
ncbi:MAG: SHOCT domain-containing protein [Chloroflexota bacterium]